MLIKVVVVLVVLLTLNWSVSSLRLMIPQKVRLCQQFYNIHGHCLLPCQYIVPTISDKDPRRKEEAEKWPVFMQGIDLGIIVQSIRTLGPQKFQELYPNEFDILKKIQFDWSNVMSFDTKFELLKHFHWLMGHLNVPDDFVIPCNDLSWPEEYAGLDLGHIAKDIERRQIFYRKKYPKQMHILMEELILQVFAGEPKEDKYLALFRNYYRIYKHLSIPNKFVIPDDDPEWPVELRGINLASEMKKLRQEGEEVVKYKYPVLYEELANMFFSRWRKVSKARSDRGRTCGRSGDTIPKWIETIKMQYLISGSILVPTRYRTPKDDPAWPVHLQDRGLGLYLSGVRTRGKAACHPAVRELLDSYDFYWQRASSHQKINKIPVIEKYYEIFGNVRINTRFVVPKNDDRWPKEYVGYRLGSAVIRIRSFCREDFQKLYPREFERLTKVGFFWTKTAIKLLSPTEIKYDMLKRYYEKYGDLNIPQDFAFEDNDRTIPEDYWGINLYPWLLDVRTKKSLTKFKQSYPHLYEDLKKMGIGWNEPEEVKKEDNESNQQ